MALALSRFISEIQWRFILKSPILLIVVSFNALDPGDPFQIFGKKGLLVPEFFSELTATIS